MQRSPYLLAGALIFLGGAASAFGLRPDEWVPVRWPGGPLEAARRVPADPEMAAVLKNWYQPVLLELLRDTPINCLVVTWSAAADPAVVRDQQRQSPNMRRKLRSADLPCSG